MRIQVGTRVLVTGKSTGCPINHVFNRTAGTYYPRSLPFMAWIGESSIKHDNKYVISYSDNLQSGDFYLSKDFEVIDCGHLEDELFEI